MPLEDEIYDSDEIVEMKNRSSKKSMFRNQCFRWLLGVVGACLFALFFFAQQYEEFATQDISAKYQQERRKASNPLDTCSTLCPPLQNTASYHEATRKLLQRAQVARDKEITKLKVLYGEQYYNDIFTTESGESIGKTAFVSPNYNPDNTRNENISKDRFVQKLMLKILTVLLKYQQCNCHSEVSMQQAPTRLVWATGGHSAAAGHGNFHHEAYTAVMERTSKAVFAAVGIDLEGRNYAMGAMDSAPELALCTEAVYGLDADIISWDFGMTDGRSWWRKFFYGNRIGVHRNRPAIVEFGVTDGRAEIAGPRLRQLTRLQEMGLTGLYQRYGLHEDPSIKNKFPDMQSCKSQDEIDAVPEFLRHFRCGEELEKGDPTCGANKFTETECRMSHRVGWHPGWKVHAFSGNLMALFMMDMLLEALDKLAGIFENHTTTTPQSVFDRLKAQEDENYKSFYNWTIDDVDPGFIPKDTAGSLNVTALFRNPAVCHTALLPSETRYRGILTDSRGGPSFEQFKRGIDYRSDTQSRDSWSLVYDPLWHYKNNQCPTTELIDFKDWFFIQARNGETEMTIPNDAERDVYLSQSKEAEGLVVLCLARCRQGRCDPGTLLWEDVNSGNVTFKVNGEPSVEATPISGCFLLKGKHGFSWRADDHGQYRVTAHIHAPDSFMKVSSVIIL